MANSSYLFFPALNNNHGNHSAPQSPGPLLPILQTNYFSIEYDDDNTERADNTTNINNNSNNNNRNRSHETTRHNHSRDVELGWATMRHDNHRDEMASAYNDDEANALQLHDVGSILTGSGGNQH
jgi:hypothetical protein